MRANNNSHLSNISYATPLIVVNFAHSLSTTRWQHRQLTPYRTAWAPLTLLLLALLLRLWGLDRFITLDEYLWVDRSRNFLLALLHGEWADTFQTGHPGVTTMWSGALGLWLYSWRQGWLQSSQLTTFLTSLSWQNQPADLLPWLRMGLVLATALTTPLVYWLTRPLIGTVPAFVATLLVAVDPWLLGHSRILHHDALAAYAMLVAILALLHFFLIQPSSFWLLLSGAATALALLTKDWALIVGGWAACLFIYPLPPCALTIGQRLRAFFIWLIAIVVLIFFLWPVLWLEPLVTLTRITQMLTVYAQNPQQTGQVWFGHLVADPGPAFYPVTLLYLMTPLATAGCIAWLVYASRPNQSPGAPPHARQVGLWLLLFAFIYLLLLSVGAKKHLRYLLPALALLNIVAGMGLAYSYQWLHKRLRPLARQWLPLCAALLLSTALLLQLAPHFPYYFTFANPLLGGQRQAAQQFLLGSGEGLELAADYLNHHDHASSLRVVADLPNVFSPFFKGHTAAWSPDTMAFAADYVVLYRYQRQLELPNRTYLDYITAHWPLLHTITLEEVPYVWIYQAPAADWVSGVRAAESSATTDAFPPGLLAYQRQMYSEHLQLTLYHYADGCQTWRVRTHLATNSWQEAMPTARSSAASARGIVQAQYTIRQSPFSMATALSIEVGVANPGCHGVHWWKLPTALFKPQ